MDSKRKKWFEERIKLYEEARQKAIFTKPYDDAIEAYKEELEKD